MTLLASGCDGVIGDPGASPGVSPPDRPNPDIDGDGIPDPAFHFDMIDEASSTGIRMMTTDELVRAVIDSTGITPDVSSFPAPLTVFNLSNDATRSTVRDVLHMRELFGVAHDVALRTDIDATLPCAADPCADADLRVFLEIAFAANPSADDMTTYRTIYAEASADKGHEFGRRAVVQAALLSPSFLYRTETGSGGTTLTAPELARKLSFFLWGAPPDDELRAAALDGSLMDDAVYQAHADRLIADPRTNAQVTHVVFEWLGMDHLDLTPKAVYDELPPGITSDMIHEIELMVEDVMERDAPLRELFDRETTYVNQNLAEHYGIEGVTGNEFQPVDLAGTERRGILTTAALLAAHGKEDGRSPMQRGHFLVNDLMCHGFPSDAGIAVMELPAAGDDASFRDRFEPLSSTSPCSNCHRTLNAGFALDIFDTVGRRWPLDEVPSSDASGFFDLPPYDRLEFVTTGEATMGLARHPAVSRCFVVQTYRYAQGRLPGSQDRETLEGLVESFEAGGQSISSLLRDIVTTERFRTVLQGGAR
jgi:hypothetical protein